MPILDFRDSTAKGPSTKKPLKLVLGTGVLVGALALGSTFAANINLNGGGNVEFGQGVATTTACDEDGITVTPFSTFINAPGAGSHKLSTMRISGIDSTSCDGKTFRIKAYGDGPDPLDLFKWEEGQLICNADTCEMVYTETGRYDFVDITRTGDDYIWTSEGSDDDDVIDRTSTAFTIDFASVSNSVRRTLLAAANDVKKITVETFDASESDLVYTVGDTGPGGGIVFYYLEAGFNCGSTFSATGSPTGGKCHYLEAAPRTWYDGTNDPGISWATDVNGNRETSVTGARETAIGSGYQNSLAIQAQTGNVAATSAAVAARAYRGGSKSDWYLPSIDELIELKINKEVADALIGGYWSSSEGAEDGAYDLGFNPWDSPGLATPGKHQTTPVRPIRAF